VDTIKVLRGTSKVAEIPLYLDRFTLKFEAWYGDEQYTATEGSDLKKTITALVLGEMKLSWTPYLYIVLSEENRYYSSMHAPNRAGVDVAYERLYLANVPGRQTMMVGWDVPEEQRDLEMERFHSGMKLPIPGRWIDRSRDRRHYLIDYTPEQYSRMVDLQRGVKQMNIDMTIELDCLTGGPKPDAEEIVR
jgi:hypothetical protein